METEVERQEIYPVLRAMFVKEKNQLNDPEITHSVVRLIQVDKYKYHIKMSTAYDFGRGEKNECISETIICQYPSTAELIYERFRHLEDVVNTGVIVKDIPFDC